MRSTIGKGSPPSLAALIPQPKATKVESDSRSVWADYVVRSWKTKDYERGVFSVKFADGEVVRVSHPCLVSRPYNWGPAQRIAKDFWRSRISGRQGRALGYSGQRLNDYRATTERNLAVPGIVAMECNGTQFVG